MLFLLRRFACAKEVVWMRPRLMWPRLEIVQEPHDLPLAYKAASVAAL
jgi:hypothetical protein